MIRTFGVMFCHLSYLSYLMLALFIILTWNSLHSYELSAQIWCICSFLLLYWTGEDGNIGTSTDTKFVSKSFPVIVSIKKKPEVTARVENKQSLQLQSNGTKTGLESLCQYDSDED